MTVKCGVQVRKGLRVQISSRPSSTPIPAMRLTDTVEDIGTVRPGMAAYSDKQIFSLSYSFT